MKRRINSGNALAEFCVVAVILIPAILVMPTLGKLADVNQSTIEATRYVAWERTVASENQKSENRIHIETINRFYLDDDLLIESDEELLDEESYINEFWQRRDEGEDRTMLPMTSIAISASNRSIPGATGADIFSEGIAAVGGAMDGAIPNARWDLEERGFIVAEIASQVDAGSYLENGRDCENNEVEGVSCVRRHYALFVDGWDAGSPNRTERRVRALVPAGTLDHVGSAISYAGAVPLFEELRHLDGMFGDVREDVLPLDRYGEE